MLKLCHRVSFIFYDLFFRTSHTVGKGNLNIFFVLQNFNYDSYKNIRVQATLEFAIDDAYFSIVDSEFFDPDYTEMYVEPNDEGINVIFSNITIIKLADPAKTNVSLIFLILFHHHHPYLGCIIFRRILF